MTKGTCPIGTPDLRALVLSASKVLLEKNIKRYYIALLPSFFLSFLFRGGGGSIKWNHEFTFVEKVSCTFQGSRLYVASREG